MQTPAERTAHSPNGAHAGPVTLINCFDVPPGREDEFFTHWQAMNTFFRAQPGYVSNRLHRAVSPQARYAFINVVVWESAEAYLASHRTAAFQARVQAPEWRAFPNTPGLYEVVCEASAAEGVKQPMR